MRKLFLILVLFFPFLLSGQILPGVISSLVTSSTVKTYIDVLNDTHTAAWYASDAASTITKDGSNYVQRWNDKLGSGHDLVSTGIWAPDYDPVWSSDGITFNGTNDILQTSSFTLNQPEFIYIVVKVFSDVHDYADIINGLTYLYGTVELAPSGIIQLYATTQANYAVSYPTDSYMILRVLFNGSSSKVIVNNGAPVTGNPGTNNPGGINLGAAVLYGTATHMTVKELIVRNISDSSGDETLIYGYLKTKYGL